LLCIGVELFSSTYESKQKYAELVAKSLYPEVLPELALNAAVSSVAACYELFQGVQSGIHQQ
jgi:hypothetical protein